MAPKQDSENKMAESVREALGRVPRLNKRAESSLNPGLVPPFELAELTFPAGDDSMPHLARVYGKVRDGGRDYFVVSFDPMIDDGEYAGTRRIATNGKFLANYKTFVTP